MKRYKKGLIYTNVGDILVSVNPFQQLDIYTEEVGISLFEFNLFNYFFIHRYPNGTTASPNPPSHLSLLTSML